MLELRGSILADVSDMVMPGLYSKDGLDTELTPQGVDLYVRAALVRTGSGASRMKCWISSSFRLTVWALASIAI